ncbi:hypothetical protein BCR44DRAFT_44996 [Catenaria anguillulae PL171]|uniref:Ankyrin repeat-containing domain protein n=1 Tax=Catenaria anguillulae PL171 TaxID=765915 RepID=A0A1Y2HX64_9FUNG|nr:hypothetical protein BCR44DRAFT_44996 [Catenaria anguillulae PL171]
MTPLALPLPLAELVLYYAPRVNHVTFNSISQVSRVLPRSLVPSAFLGLTLVVNGYLQCARPWTLLPKFSLTRLMQSLSPEDVVWLAQLLMPKLIQKHPTRPHNLLAWSFIDLATQHGILDALKLLHERAIPLPTAMILEKASHAGHIHVLEWLQDSIADFATVSDSKVGHAFRRAAQGGQQDVLSWWLDQRQFSADVIMSAAIGAAGIGHFGCVRELIQWTNGWEWGGDLFWRAASRGGNVDILDLAIQHDAPLPIESVKVMDIASIARHVHVLDWWFLNAPDLSLLYTHKALDEASQAGSLPVLNWWVRSGLELRFTPNALQEAVVNRHWDVVAWWQGLGVYKYIVNGEPSSVDAEELARNRLVTKDRITLASFGRLNWMRALCPLTAETPFDQVTHVQQVATMFGHVHILEAYKHLFDGDEDRNDERHDHDSLALKTAIRNGHRACIQWVAQNLSCVSFLEYEWVECAETAVECANLGIVVDLLSNPMIRRLLVGESGGISDLFVIACRNNKSDNATAILDFLFDQIGGCLSDSLTRSALKAGMEKDHLHVFQWWSSKDLHLLKETDSALFQDALLRGNEQIMDWFLNHGLQSSLDERKAIHHATIDSLIAKRSFPTLHWIAERHRLLNIAPKDKMLLANELRKKGLWNGPADFF